MKKKTRIAGNARSKKVTGLIIYNSNYGIGKTKFKELRAKIHHLTLKNEQENFELLNHVNGWIAYLQSVDDARYKKLSFYINKLRERNPETLLADLNYNSKL